MGREVQGEVRFRGEVAEGKALLESTELILRGDIKARIPRAALNAAAAGPDGLTVQAEGEALHIAMSEAEAARWVKAIATPPPTLAAKLGIGPDKRAFVLGDASDPALAEALVGAHAAAPDQATLLLAMIEDAYALDTALALAAAHPALPLWCVYPKGKAADPGDAAVRHALRAAGWIDTKTCGVSQRLTATRYSRR